MTFAGMPLAGRSRWQRRAAAELTSILDAHADLPVIAWTVGPAGSTLAGHINGLAPAGQVRDAFEAWRTALRLGEQSQTVTGGGTVRHLRAAACRNQVRIAVTATVFDDEGEAVTS